MEVSKEELKNVVFFYQKDKNPMSRWTTNGIIYEFL